MRFFDKFGRLSDNYPNHQIQTWTTKIAKNRFSNSINQSDKSIYQRSSFFEEATLFISTFSNLNQNHLNPIIWIRSIRVCLFCLPTAVIEREAIELTELATQNRLGLTIFNPKKLSKKRILPQQAPGPVFDSKWKQRTFHVHWKHFKQTKILIKGQFVFHQSDCWNKRRF